MPKRTVAHAAHAAAHVEDQAVGGPPESPGSPAPWEDREATERARRASKAKAASTRRRRVDPTTCEPDYSQAQLEFMMAMQEYKKSSGRMYPTWSEVLEVLVGLGYAKPLPDAGPHLSPPHRRRA